MKCFIHMNDEAIAVCKICGKAMCGNCSAYTNHSGICPECMRDEFIKERNKLREEIRSLRNKMILYVVLAVIVAIISVVTGIISGPFLFAGVVISVVLAIFALVNHSRCKPLQTRLDFLTGEIEKLNQALRRSAAII